jgi:hypothetical protein
MILIEIIQRIVHDIIHAIYWFITARDCEHCVYSKRDVHWYGTIFYIKCTLPYANEDECKDSITRVHFKKKEG